MFVTKQVKTKWIIRTFPGAPFVQRSPTNYLRTFFFFSTKCLFSLRWKVDDFLIDSGGRKLYYVFTTVSFTSISTYEDTRWSTYDWSHPYYVVWLTLFYVFLIGMHYSAISLQSADCRIYTRTCTTRSNRSMWNNITIRVHSKLEWLMYKTIGTIVLITKHKLTTIYNTIYLVMKISIIFPFLLSTVEIPFESYSR